MKASKESAITKYTPMDLSALEEQEKQIGYGGGKSEFHKFKDGRNVLRFLPGLHGNQFVVPYYNHFVDADTGSKDGKSFGHPCAHRMAKLPCVTCSLAAKLSRGTAADRAVADSINPRPRILALVVDRSEPDKGVQPTAFGKTVYDALKLQIKRSEEEAEEDGTDPTYFTDPANGLDLVIEKTGKGLRTTYAVSTARKRSPLDVDAARMAELLSSAPDLARYVVVPSDADVVSRLAHTVLGPHLDLLSDAGTTRARPKTSARPAHAVDVDDSDDQDRPY